MNLNKYNTLNDLELLKDASDDPVAFYALIKLIALNIKIVGENVIAPLP